MKKLLLIDGNSIANRAFYGVGANLLKNAEGLYTGAVFGFINIVSKVIESEKPTHCLVAFDVKHPTFRHEMYSEYKGTRHAPPEEFVMQLPLIKEVLDAYNIKRAEIPGFEADDIIGSLASVGENEGAEVVILTGDKDSLQLVDKNVTVLLPVTTKGTTSVTRVTPELVHEVFNNVGADQVITMKAIMGDTSDNIPGCKGIGPKGAFDLISKYETLDGIYAHIDEIKGANRQKLIDSKELCYLSYTLATIKRDIPFTDIAGTGDFEYLLVKEPNYGALLELFKKFEFRKLIKSMNLEEKAFRDNVMNPGKNLDNEDLELSLFDQDFSGNEGEAKDNGNIIKKRVSTKIVPYGEEIYDLSGVESIFFISNKDSSGHLTSFVVFGPGKDTAVSVDVEYEIKFFIENREILENKNVEKYFFDAKPIILEGLKNGVSIGGIKNDLAICAYLADSTRKLDEYISCVRFFTGKEIDSVDFFPEVVKAAEKYISEIHCDKLLFEIEIPLITVLAKMEFCGFKVNCETLISEGIKFDENLERLKNEIYNISGEEFNINSPKQLGEILFEKLKIPGGKKSKTGYKTGQEILEELVFESPIIPLILEYRQNAKLKSTYIDGLLAVVDKNTGKVHTTFNQMVTATGRLSSSEPNLQNIPVRHELGRTIRKAFLASDENHILVDADYSQIELRLLACLSGDENMVNAFNSGMDIHRLTAAEVNNVTPEEVTSEMRSAAKAVNFGIVYGMSEFGLAKEIGVSVAEARRYIAAYFRKFPGVREFLEELKANAKKLGYAETIYGRRRYLPELLNPKYPIRQFGERVAMNMPIQGAAADIIKMAMVKVDREIKNRGLSAKLILQVHDELLIDAPVEEKEQVENLLRETMESVVSLGVPFPVAVESGYEWSK